MKIMGAKRLLRSTKSQVSARVGSLVPRFRGSTGRLFLSEKSTVDIDKTQPLSNNYSYTAPRLVFGPREAIVFGGV